MPVKKRIPAAVLTGLVGLALALAGCGGASSGSSGNIVRFGVFGTDVDSLNPFVGETSLSLMAYHMLYPFLYLYNGGSQPTATWATGYTVSDGGRTWTFTTRPGQWSDGQPLTAADAAWTLNTTVKFRNSAAAQLSVFASDITAATAPNPHTLVIRLAKPTGELLYDLANIPILPRHIWARYATGSGAQLKTYPNLSPVAGGPFVLSKYQPNQFVGFVRNKHYFGTPLKLSGFGVFTYSNSDALINAVENNQIDIALDVPTTVLSAVRKQSDLRVLSVPGYDTLLLGINSNPAKKTDPELRNPTVREAIALGINRQQIMKTMTQGLGSVTPSILPSGQSYSDDGSVPTPTYDPAKANQLLDSLGFKRGPNGIRVANGHEMSYRLLFGNTTLDAPLDVNLVAGYLKALGMKIQEIESDPTAYTAEINAGHYTQFEFSVDDYNPDYSPDRQLVLLTCSQFGAENETGYCNKQYDRLYTLQTTQSGAARRRTVNQMQQIVMRDKPLIPIFTSANVAVERKSVHGFQETFLTVINSLGTQWLNDITVK